jgi:hypothetical protein
MVLNVDSNEKWGDREGHSNSASVWHCGDWGLFAIWTCRFSVNNLFTFLNWIRRCFVNPLQIWSAMPIQDINTSAPIYWCWRVISANTTGVVNVNILNRQSGSNGKLVSSYWPKLAMLCLFVETMPIYKAVATGNRNNEFYRDTFKLQITLDRHNARQKLNYCLLPDPPLFSLLSTFNNVLWTFFKIENTPI